MQADFLEREAHPSAPAMPLRKAAMLLHSMAETDRRWMLARLDSAQRSRLDGLLDELRALEFPVDAALVRESLEPATESTVRATPTDASLAGWRADQAANVLLPEPDDVVALILRAGPWPWAPALRARLGSARLRAVEASRYSVAVDISTNLRAAALQAATTRFLALYGAAPPQRKP